jgi:prepilin-type N-terminal cleavage/methylation domain-containing protein
MKNKSGFTLIEVLIATVIFGLSIIALVQTGVNSLRSVADSEKLFKAVQLGHSKMGEMISVFQNFVDKNGIKDNLNEKKEGKFEAPFEGYAWTATLTTASIVVTRNQLVNLLQKLGEEEDTIEEKVESQKLMIGNLNKAIKGNFGEVTVKILWEQFGKKQVLPIVSHVVPKKPKIEFSLQVDFESGASGLDSQSEGGSSGDVSSSGGSL